jgi:hypothetical protein
VSAPTTTPPFVFGIYPGGPAGTVGPSGSLKPEDPARRLAVLQQLRGSSSTLILHLYASYSGPGSSSAAAQVQASVAAYTAAGFQVELVLTYRPTDRVPATDVPGFVQFVRDGVNTLGADPGLVSLQVTNEANVTGAPAAADGDYPGAEDALIRGVIAAKSQARADGFTQLRIGFNWAYQLGAAEDAFWGYLGTKGGPAFRAALDWVGVDAYPGTWGPALRAAVDLPTAAAAATDSALGTLRTHFMALASIAAAVPIHVSESGYPTGTGRSEATQAAVLSAIVNAVYAARATHNVSAYNWFDLRDADSSNPSFESQYGLLHDDYTPKPAFAVYQQLIATL